MIDKTSPLPKGSRLMHESARKTGVIPKTPRSEQALPSSEYEETDIS